MAKKKSGYYSPEAIQARQQFAVDEYNRVNNQNNQQAQQQQDAPKGATATVADPNYTVRTPSAKSDFKTSIDGNNWNYINAKTDMQGKPIETRNFMGRTITPKGFDPNGNPYFGEGVNGWLQKWAYKLSEESATQGESQQAWQKFAETSNQFSRNAMSATYKSQQDYFSQDAQKLNKEQFSLFIQGAGELFDASRKWLESQDQNFESGAATGGFKTPITYALRAVNAAVGMTLEGFQWLSEVPEKIGGAQRAMREYATERGSMLPELTFDPLGDDYYERVKNDPKFASMYAPDNGFKANKEAADFASRLFVVPLAMYDYVRFFTSPGTAQEKKVAVQKGWIEGRMLYTEIFKDTVREEYLSRVRAGEDPALLAMEMEDPWIEAGMEMLLDPSNFLGLLGKAEKAASTITEAGRVVENSGLLSKTEFISEIKNISKVDNDIDAAERAGKVAQMIADESTLQARRLASAQEYKLTSYVPEANKIIHRKTMGNYISAVTQALRNAGGTPDDVLDFVNALRKFATGDITEIRDGMATISHMPIQMMAYNDAAFEVGYMMNKILGEGDFAQALEKGGGNFSELAKWFDDKMTKATNYAFPSVLEMQRAGEKAKELAKVGEAIPEETQRLSEAFKALQKEHPGYVKWANFQDIANKTLRPINGFLANNYFSLSYGYAARNFMQNMFTLWVDGGLVWDSKGLAKTERLDNIILRLNGGQMPEMFKETETLIKSTTEGSLGNRFFSWLNSKKYSPAQLGQAAEIYAGKMIYVKKYRETMDSIATLGGMLPEVAKWEDAGFTASQANDFVDLLRANDYDEVATFEAFSRKYGDGTVDKWRQLDWVNPEAKKGLQESGSYWDEISQFVNKEGNPTQREVLDFIDELKQRVKKDALKVTDEPTRVLDSDPIAKAVMDDREFAGKYGNADVDNALLSQKLQASRAMNEFETALREMMLSVAKNPDEASQTLARKIVNEFNAAPKEVEKVLQDTDEMRRFVVDLRNRVSRGENPALLWDESIMGKKPKGLISKDMFLKQLWEGHYFPKRSEMWNSYYANKLEKYMEFAKEQPGLSMLFEKANYENLKYQQYADYVYSNGKIFAKPPVLVSAAVGSTENANNIRSIANAYGISSIANSGANKDKAVLNIINKYAPPSYVDEAGQAVEAYAKLEDVPPDVAEKVFSQYSGQTPKGFIKKNGEVYEANNLLEGLPVPPPRDPNTSPAGHVFTETKDGMLSALNHIEQGIRDRWGLKISTNGDMNALQNILPDLTERVAIAKSKSQIVAEKYRDFALLPYAERTNMDMALGMVYPYQFWYSRSYKNWMQRAFMTNPEIISRYANLKEALATEQRDLPDWWKSQFDVMGFLGGSDKKLFGIDTSHPMYINLEAAVFPLYGLTGTDFNDPKKRVDWWSSTLDDMGKFGPSIWAPLQVATAAYYAAVGEKDVAARWGGRLIPQTQTIKAVTGLLGKPVELDPSIWAFNGGMDSYEEGRVNRALAAMANEGYSQEELMQAAYSKSGPLWDEAYRRAVVERAPGQISSFLLGTGFKGRTENDVMIDQFYSDYSRMQNLYRGGLMTDAQYQEAFRVLREEYPFTDVLLLSRRAGDRDSAYAYNVLSRIPPAELNQVSEVLGVKPYMIEQFYSNKGDLSKMTPQDKARFMAAIVDLGAMLKMPDGATREEWNAARQTYAEMNRMLAQSYGSDIQDKISRYYDLSTDERKQYLEAYPEVSQALEDKTAYITNTPVLSAYYGGLDTIERYYSNQIYDQLEQEFGQDIQDKMEQYYFLKDNLQPKDAKRYYNENNLKAYEARKKELQKQIDAKIIEMAKNIPEGTGYQIRPDFQVQSGYQQDALNYATVNQQAQTAQEIYGQLSPAAQELLQEYYDKGTKLPYAVTRQIDYIAGKYGLSQYEALRLMGVELP